VGPRVGLNVCEKSRPTGVFLMLLYSDIILVLPAHSNTTIQFVTKHEILVAHATPAGATEEGKTAPFRKHVNNFQQPASVWDIDTRVAEPPEVGTVIIQ
jgi:hypothetical protein